MKLFFILSLNLFLTNLVLASSEMPISTSSGIVHGIKKNNVIIFEDIPYAKPPLGVLRWKAPREITVPGKINSKNQNFCVQRSSNLGGVDDDKLIVGSEDCLYLDIFIPKKNIEEDLPVMFWIHGGGNTSGLKDLYDFSKMVRKHNVIVVRINYRLGPFGWFTHPSIQDFQNGEDKTSNFGTLDIIMALKWVNKNISNFGGNPSNVTIFGESAGGHNVLSLLVSSKAKGLFHKAISMSGYTTSISTEDAFNPSKQSATSEYATKKVIEKLSKKYNIGTYPGKNYKSKIREMLLTISSEDFFDIYANREPYEELPLLTADGIVIPQIGLKQSLSKKEYVNIVPTIAGSNRDEVKLWLATARYFADLDYSVVGSILKIPKVKITNEESFEAFNFYRSSAWKLRGVDYPLQSLDKAGNEKLYAYRYDWDDHRRFIVADFKKLIGAAHATEIPLLTGNTDLVGGYPLSDLIYPPSFSKRYTSKNMMKFWTNFAKTGEPGISTNLVNWEPYNNNSEFMIIDKKKNLRMSNDTVSYKSLTKQIINDNRVSKLEKCVILLQMFTYVGDDLYDSNMKDYPNLCNRSDSVKFLKDNASFIEY